MIHKIFLLSENCGTDDEVEDDYDYEGGRVGREVENALLLELETETRRE